MSLHSGSGRSGRCGPRRGRHHAATRVGIRRRWVAAYLAVITGLAVAVAGQASGTAATTTPTDTAGTTLTRTVTRDHLVNGQDQVVDSRTVTLTVSNTTDLHDRQTVSVSWSGAHPTGGIVTNPNSPTGAWQEYPMVLLQCRGTDSSTAPAPDQITPQTCWAPAEFERYLTETSTGTVFPAWRTDRYAAAADRTQFSQEPAPRPAGCPPQSEFRAEHWLPFLSTDGTKYYGGSNNCAGLPPEASTDDSSSNLPTNSTYAVTNTDGTGQSTFNVRDAQDNASLGCSVSVPCSLVAVPIMGISCDTAAAGLPAADRPAAGSEADAAFAACSATGKYQPGELAASNSNQFSHDRAVAGELWWSESNWRNRISVPLSFAPTAATCDLANGHDSADIYGSELMSEATSQWTPHFCLNASDTPVKHVQVGEPQAKSLLNSQSVQAAFDSRAPDLGYQTPTVHAPVAATGFAISYAIDDANGNRYTNLKLTPRLLAKLLTESYPDNSTVRKNDPGLSANPYNISADPEFKALNPGVRQWGGSADAAAELYALSSDSDVIYALTSYINADPEARAFLDGTPDPWGMVVNPNYLRIQLPVQHWQLLDTYTPVFTEGQNVCLANNPVPYLPLVAAPNIRLANIALSLQFVRPNSQTNCFDPSNGQDLTKAFLKTNNAQTPGFRFMLGLTSVASADRYGLDTAALQTHVAADAPAKFTDATGRTFVAPTQDSLGVAVQALVRDTASGDWRFPYSTVRTAASQALAYPGVMVVYLDVPTSGLDPALAAVYATFLRFAAGTGQIAGSGIGELPPGYLPMTAANGMQAFLTYDATAADDITAQAGGTPDVPVATATPTPPASASATPSASPTAHATTSRPAATVAVNAPAPATSASAPIAVNSSAPLSPAVSTSATHPAKTTTAAATPSPSPSATPLAIVPLAKTVGPSTSAGQTLLWLLIALLVAGPLFAVGRVCATRFRSQR